MKILSISLTTSVLAHSAEIVFSTCWEREKIIHQKSGKNKSINGQAAAAAAARFKNLRRKFVSGSVPSHYRSRFELICLAEREIFLHIFIALSEPASAGLHLFIILASRFREKTFNDGNFSLALATRLCVASYFVFVSC